MLNFFYFRQVGLRCEDVESSMVKSLYTEHRASIKHVNIDTEVRRELSKWTYLSKPSQTTLCEQLVFSPLVNKSTSHTLSSRNNSEWAHSHVLRDPYRWSVIRQFSTRKSVCSWKEWNENKRFYSFNNYCNDTV